jgi:hypothetical protein
MIKILSAIIVAILFGSPGLFAQTSGLIKQSWKQTGLYVYEK